MPTRPPGWSPAEFAILRTVVYASLFEYPLTCAELRHTLIECEQSETDILRTYAASTRLRERIECRDGWFFPRGHSAWIEQRRRRQRRSLAFLHRHRSLLRVICALPFVRLVALSGSLAALNAERGADLDLFVITKAGHAWTITLAVIALSKLWGRRRVICLNFVMTDTALRVEQQDLFTANQIIQLRPICGRATYEAFIASNPFVRERYPNFSGDLPGPLTVAFHPIAQRVTRIVEQVLDRPAQVLETVSRLVYSAHLRRRARRWASPGEVRLLPAYVKLHTHSHRQSILTRFDEACREALRACARDGRPAASAVDQVEVA